MAVIYCFGTPIWPPWRHVKTLFWEILACSRRSDSGERCEVKRSAKNKSEVGGPLSLVSLYFSSLSLLRTALHNLNAWNRVGGFLQQQKTNRFRLAKEQLCTCITLFCLFLSRCWMTATWNFLSSLADLSSRWPQHKNFLFLNLDTVLSDSTRKNVANIWQIKWDRWSLNSGNPLFKWRFDLLSSRNFATIATWGNDFSSLL